MSTICIQSNTVVMLDNNVCELYNHNTNIQAFAGYKKNRRRDGKRNRIDTTASCDS